MNDKQSTNIEGNIIIEVNLSGAGSEFNQGLISKEEYNNWLELKDNIFWNQFCEDNLEKDGYWEISDVSSFTAINRDFLKIEIKINNKSFFNGSFDKLIDKYFDEEGEILNSKNESGIYGANNLPDNWDTFFKNEEFSKRDKVLVTTKTSENFSVNGELKISGDFNIKKFGLIVLSTDEMGYGVDFGDYVLGFRYEDENVDCEFPGGVGNLEAPSFA